MVDVGTPDHSKTSNSGPSEKRTTSVQRTAHLPPIDFTKELIHSDTDQSPTYLCQYKITSETDSEDNADACPSLSLRHRRRIQRSSTIVALPRIVLAFFVNVKQRRGPKMRLHRDQQSQITTPTGTITWTII